MSEEPRNQLLDDEEPRPGESFLSRFHRRKTEARLAEMHTDTAREEHQDQTEAVVQAVKGTDDIEDIPSDADMPSLETLNADSDYTGFLSPKVSEPLRRAALRKLFRGAEFNIVDGLDEYAEDFTTFEPLGDIVTADMRHMIEVEAKKKAEAIKRALLEDGSETEAGEQQVGEEELTIESQNVQDTGDEPRPAPPLDP